MTFLHPECAKCFVDYKGCPAKCRRVEPQEPRSPHNIGVFDRTGLTTSDYMSGERRSLTGDGLT